MNQPRTAVEIAAFFEQQFLEESVERRALPTVRHLAASLRVSPATVAAAYKLLRARGLVSGQGRQGTRVVSRLAPVPRTKRPQTPSGVRDLSTAEPDPALLPSLDHALRSLPPDQQQPGEGPDWGDFVALAMGEFEADGLPAGAVAVTSGGLDAIERILREHLRPGDSVAVEDPTSDGLVDLLTVSGYRAVPVSLDDDGPIPAALDAALARGCQAVIMTPRAQNPTGAALSAQRATELREVLKRFPRTLLIEHDHAGPVAGAVFQTLCGASPWRWAVVRSLSAFLGPDLRVAVVAGDDLTIGRVKSRQALGARWVSRILQRLAFSLWSDPASGRRIARVGEIYAERRTRLLTALSDHGIAAHGRSGFNVWVPVRSEETVVESLARSGWAVAPGESFRIQAGPGIRITTSALLPDDALAFAADLARLGGLARVARE